MVGKQTGTSSHKMDRACDVRLARFILHSLNTNDYRQHCHVEIQHSTVDWDCSMTQTLLETLKTQNRLRRGNMCIFGSRTFVPISWSFAESQVISLGAGLRMDGIPTLDLWDLGIEVLHSSLNQP